MGAATVGSGGRSPEPGRGGKAVPCCGGRSRACGGRLHAGGCTFGRRRAGQVPCFAFPAAASHLVLLHRERCNSSSPVPWGRTVLGGGQAVSAWPYQRVGAGEGGSSWRCGPGPAVSTQLPVNLRGVLRAAGGPSPPAPLTPPRRPLPSLPCASRPQGPGRGGGVHKVGCLQYEFSLFSPAKEHAKVREADADVCA